MLRWLRRHKAREADLEEEISSHLRMAVHDRVERGEAQEDARCLAQREFGNAGLVKEVTREMWGWTAVERLGQDLRYAARMLHKNPGFSLVVMLTLALGIGANTAIFSVIHAALTPLSIAEPERAVMVWTENAKRDWHRFPASVPDYQDWKASGIFSALGAVNEIGVNLRLRDSTERINGLTVTDGFFKVLSTPPLIGRVFHEQDLRPGHDQAIILRESLWRSRFASDPSILGRNIVVDGAPRTVIGVLPQRFPKVGKEEILTPYVFTAQQLSDRGSRFFGVMGRLRPGVTFSAAQQRLTELSVRLSKQYPNEDGGTSAQLQPVEDAFIQDARTLLVILFGAVGFVLLIACANIANLLLARGTTRAKEMALRAALGASRWALARQLLTESVLLAFLGGVLAILPAVWGIHFIASYHLEELPNADLVTLNRSVLGFNIALSLLTGILFGLVPAWQVWKTDVNDTLKASARSLSSGMHQRLRAVFVVSEVALTLVLLVGAGLMLQSFVKMRSANPGYDPHDVLTLRVALSDKKYSNPGQQAAFFRRLLGRTRALPGVRSVGAIDGLPTGDELHASGMFIVGRPEPRQEDTPVVLHNAVLGGFFQATRIRLLRGRYLDDTDGRDSPRVVVIDDWLAKRHWPNEDPVGKQIRLGKKEAPMEIVGVVGSVDQGVLVKIMNGQVGQVYRPYAQDPKPTLTLTILAGGDLTSLIPAMRSVVRDTDMDQPIFDTKTLEEARAEGQATQRLATWLLSGFAIVALLLVTIGIYGVIAYNVGQRTREFGIRMSLGAQRDDVLGMVVRQGAFFAAIGVVIGLAGAFALTRLMGGLLHGVGATDPATFVGVTGLLACIAMAASYVPARRATKVDPMIALRCE